MAFKTPEPIIKNSLDLYNSDLISNVENDPTIDDDELLVEVLRRNANGTGLSTDDQLLEGWVGRKLNPTEPGPNASWTWKDWAKYDGHEGY